MYPVSNAFLLAVKQNTRKYYWTGRITAKGGMVYDFDQNDIVKGSGYVTSHCCGSTEINRICDGCLMYASQQGKRLTDEHQVRYVLEHEMLGGDAW